MFIAQELVSWWSLLRLRNNSYRTLIAYFSSQRVCLT